MPQIRLKKRSSNELLKDWMDMHAYLYSIYFKQDNVNNKELIKNTEHALYLARRTYQESRKYLQVLEENNELPKSIGR
jgi:hypothetical protein